MRTLLLPLLAALTSVIASEALSPSVDETPLDISNVITGDSHSLVKRAPVPASDVLWQSYICRGQKLQLLDTLDPQNAQQFGTPLNSPWTGTLVNELALWGYDDNSNVQDIKDQCDFSMRPIFESTLKAMGISAKSESDGGPNKCFYYVHKNGPAIERQPNGQLPPVAFQYYTVNGRRYRVTAAHHVIGINAQDGVIHFINRVSAASSAKTLWGLGGRDQPPKDELPALASSSDIAWGLWERMSPGRLSNINYVFSHAVANGFTRAIVTRATEGRPLRTWPGEVFESGTEEYWALLGSPNGLGVGYLLGQHKPQFGHNRYVSAIHVFQGSPSNPMYPIPPSPFLCFVVKAAPVPAPDIPTEIQMPGVALDERVAVPMDVNENSVVGRSEDGKSIVRRHKIFAKA